MANFRRKQPQQQLQTNKKENIVGLKKFALKKWINFMTINIIIVIMGQSRVTSQNSFPLTFSAIAINYLIMAA
ncbi:hypothetical protein T09_6960 [Trichinella sp. T9]|nr:hypothetical protein T09_6960 [Trichinella sp. T9]